MSRAEYRVPYGTGELAFAAGVAAALFGEMTSAGVFFPNSTYANVGRRFTGESIYHEYNTLTEIAGGIGVTLPFGEDFKSGPVKEQLEKVIVRNPTISPDESLKIWQLVENVGASPMTAWYEIAGVHGGGSPIMETIALSAQFDFDSRKRLARYLAGIDQEFDDARDISSAPTFGEGLASGEPAAE